LDVLQQFIDNSQGGDNPPPSDLSPIELGEQEWEDGRLVYFCCSDYPYGVNPFGFCNMDYELSGQIPTEIGNLTNLEFLGLWYNHFTGTIPSEIGDLTKLTSLGLQQSNLTGEIPSEFWNLVQLIELSLFENQLSGDISKIGNFENLNYLSLGFNQLTGEIPTEIGNLTNLTYLGLRNNQLTGEIPPEIGNLTNLTGLGMMRNQLTGEIPSEIGNLVNLTHFSCLENQLTGEIPSEIGNLVNLTELYLWGNQFYGEIPVEICNLTNLIWSTEYIGFSPYGYIYDNNFCLPYPDCLVNQEPFTDENNNGIWDEGEPFEDTNENGIYEEDYVGYQDTSECPGEECEISDYTGYYDCSHNCIPPVLYEDWLGDETCNETDIDFNCYNLGYDCGDCGQFYDDPSGLCCSGLRGDVNEDGVINILDVVTGINIILETISYTNCQSYLLDFNEDGSIDVLDIVEMVNYILPD